MDSGVATGPARGRVIWVDVLRVVATFQMVQGHTLDAVLAIEQRAGPVYEAWRLTRGLTAVAFLFLAGAAFELATAGRLGRQPLDGLLVRRRVGRALMLILLGYALHFPAAQLHSFGAAMDELLIVDVLQCIGVSLLVLQLLSLRCRSAAELHRLSLVMGIAILVATPLFAPLVPRGPLAPLTAYFTARGGSLFPLVPWAGHMFLGVAVAGLLRGTAGAAGARRLLIAALVGAGLAGAAWVAGSSAVSGAAVRLSCVILTASLVAWASRSVQSMPAPLRVLSSDTLFIYVFHILLVYGAGVGLADLIGPRLSAPAALAVTLGVLVLSGGMSLVTARLRSAAAPALARMPGTS